MSFTAWYYPFFLAAVALAVWRLPRRGRLVLLLAASYAFYGAWDVRFLSLIGASTAMDFLCGMAIAGERRSTAAAARIVALPVAWIAVLSVLPGVAPVPVAWVGAAAAAALAFLALYEGLWRLPERTRPRAFLALQVAYNLGILFFFKYFGFFVDSANALLAAAGLGGSPRTIEILLPVGISFYTFQSIAYAVDVCRGRAQPCRDPLLFAAFIAFFPQLVAGPIERSAHLLPQLDARARFTPAMLHEGVVLLLVGYFKKLFVANNCALVADHFFDGSGATSPAWVVLGTVAFAFQIYGDFSGYTDIARGSAKLLGVTLAENFRMPYLARTPSEFWRRWHISLSSWIRDYLYVPLGGNRGTPARTLVNLYASMLLAGLWHGAAWNFVLWGAFHASVLALYRFVPALRGLEAARGARRVGAVAAMFAFTLLGWLVFRARSAEFIVTALVSLAGGSGSARTPLDWHGPALWTALHVVPLLVLQYATRRGAHEAGLAHRAVPLRALDYVVMLLLVVSSTSFDQEFIYFQF